MLIEKMTLKLEIRKLNKSHFQSGKTPREIYKMLDKTVSIWTIYRWVISFNQTVLLKLIFLQVDLGLFEPKLL